MDLIGMGIRIQEARNEKGWNQDEFAEKLEVSKQTVGNIETGKKGTRLQNFVKICQVLEKSADYILFGK